MKKMKKMNRKGFTLVELLVVLVILTVIMAIAIPSVTSSIERSKQKQYDSKMEIIISAVDIYIDRHKNSIDSNSIITIVNLINDDLITLEQAKDPFNEKRTICGYYLCNSNSCTDGEWKKDCLSVNGTNLYLDID